MTIEGQNPDEGPILTPQDAAAAKALAPARRLTIEDILAAPDLEERDVDVPQWDGAVRIRAFTKGRAQELRRDARRGDEIDTDALEMFMFIAGVVDPVFSKENYEQLRGKSSAAVDTVLQAILSISGLQARTEERPSSIDEAERTFRP